MREPRPATTPVRRECDTRWLLCLAALLIANSHLEQFYPVRWLAADGLLGNSIFFFLCGYGVMRSELANHRSFVTFYLRRVLRIYPTLWLAEIIFCAVAHGWHDWTLREWLHQFIWPTHYAFVMQVMIFYIPIFFLARLRSRRIFQFTLLLVALVFGGLYASDLRAGGLDTLTLGTRNPWLWHALFLWTMLLGAWAGLPRTTRARPLKWWLLPLLFVAYVAAKLLMVRGWKIPALGISSANGYALLFALVTAMLCQLLRVAEDGRLAFALRQIPFVSGATVFVGALTLEIYLFHGFVQSVDFIRDLRFPLNVAVFFAGVFLVSWAVARLVKTLRRVVARFLPGLAAAD